MMAKTFKKKNFTKGKAIKPKKSSSNQKHSSKKQKLSARAKAKLKLAFLEDKNLHDFLHNIIGQEGMDVVKRIAQKEVSDVDLAETMELKPNIIRKHLYALYEAGVVTYRRHRSKTGWYTYYWKLHPERISSVIESKRNSEIKKLQELLNHENTNHYYECKNKCTRVGFDIAMETQFKCGKCSEKLEFSDSKERVNELEGRLRELTSGNFGGTNN